MDDMRCDCGFVAEAPSHDYFLFTQQGALSSLTWKPISRRGFSGGRTAAKKANSKPHSDPLPDQGEEGMALDLELQLRQFVGEVLVQGQRFAQAQSKRKKPRIAPGLCIETDLITCGGSGRSLVPVSTDGRPSKIPTVPE